MKTVAYQIDVIEGAARQLGDMSARGIKNKSVEDGLNKTIDDAKRELSLVSPAGVLDRLETYLTADYYLGPERTRLDLLRIIREQ